TIEGGWRGDFLLRDPEIYVSVVRSPPGAELLPIFRVNGARTVIIDGFQLRGGRFGVFAEEGANLVVRDCHFREQLNGSRENPLGARPGGAVRMRGGSLLLERVTIDGILTAFHGAALGLESMQQVVIRDCQITNCSSFPFIFDIFTPAVGGALYVADVGDLRIERTGITQCNSFSRGGLGYVLRTPLTAVDCRFERGNGSFAGGAFVLDQCPALSFSNCEFILSRANQGGALWVQAGGGLAVSGCTFRFNVNPNATDAEGGAIWLDSTPFTILDSSFEGNVGSDPCGRGGAVRLDNSGGTVTNTVFTGERAIGRGGAWSQIGGHTVFDRCRFENNVSAIYGGALHIELAGTLEVRNSLFRGNSAQLGGAISASFTAAATTNHCTLVGNSAGSAGGAIYLDTGATGRVENSIVCCAPRGDLIHCSSAELEMVTSDLWNDDSVNVRAELGGGCPDVIGVEGTISLDPLFCNAQGPGFELSGASDCIGAANDGGDMGWASQGCAAPAPLTVREESWGAIKGRYRSR
ncbi:MAG: right-handed parallel beta-helix repeat-containing protein, partial [bacterium]